MLLWATTIEKVTGNNRHMANAAEAPPHDGEQSRDQRAFTIREVARITGLSRTSIYEAIRQKLLHKKKFGKRTLILCSEVDRFLQSLPTD